MIIPFVLGELLGKGGKNRRRGKNENEETKRELEFKEAGQEYAQVRERERDPTLTHKNNYCCNCLTFVLRTTLVELYIPG